MAGNGWYESHGGRIGFNPLRGMNARDKMGIGRRREMDDYVIDVM